LWIFKLHENIYGAVGLQAYSLAAMGSRAIIDWIITTQAKDYGSFPEKLKRLLDKNMITQMQSDVIMAVFDPGSAAAHRGYSPSGEEVFTMLDITEMLIEHFYIGPLRQKRQADAANALKSRTPRRNPKGSNPQA
jgi:hypothetical protein